MTNHEQAILNFISSKCVFNKHSHYTSNLNGYYQNIVYLKMGIFVTRCTMMCKTGYLLPSLLSNSINVLLPLNFSKKLIHGLW